MKAKKILAALIAASACLSMAAMSVSAESDPAKKPDPALLDGTKFAADGDLSEWTEQKLHGMTLQGEGDTANKSVTYYGAMTTTGLYLAFDVYHDLYATGQTNWWENTNCEMFINKDKSIHAYATGMDSDCKVDENPEAGCKITNAVMKTEKINDPTQYHSTFEAFFATDDLPKGYTPKFPNTINVGMVWKTPEDWIIGGQYYKNADGSDDFWALKGGIVNDCPLLATPQGLYWASEYTAPLLRQGEFQLRKNGEGKYDMRLLFLGDSEYLKDFKDATVTITFTKNDETGKKTKTMTHKADKAYKTIKAKTDKFDETYTADDGYGYIGLVVKGIGTNDVESFSAKVTLNYDGGSVTYYLGSCDDVAAEVAKLSK